MRGHRVIGGELGFLRDDEVRCSFIQVAAEAAHRVRVCRVNSPSALRAVNGVACSDTFNEGLLRSLKDMVSQEGPSFGYFLRGVLAMRMTTKKAPNPWAQPRANEGGPEAAGWCLRSAPFLNRSEELIM